MADAVFRRLWSTPWSSPPGCEARKGRLRAPDPDPDGVLDPGTRVVHEDSGDSGRVASEDIADEADEDVEPGRAGWVEEKGGPVAVDVEVEDWVTEGRVEREMIVVQRDLSWAREDSCAASSAGVHQHGGSVTDRDAAAGRALCFQDSIDSWAFKIVPCGQLTPTVSGSRSPWRSSLTRLSLCAMSVNRSACLRGPGSAVKSGTRDLSGQDTPVSSIGVRC
jgi:hypothetical protein